MIRAPGLRTRLTLFVTGVFAVALTLTSLLAFDRLESGLVQDSRADAEAVLGRYLDTINGGVASVGVVEDDRSTQFFYRDQNGNDLTEGEYFRLIAAQFDRELNALNAELAAEGVVGPILSSPTMVVDAVPIGGSLLSTPEVLFGDVIIEPDTGALLDPDGVAISFIEGPVPDGQPQPVDLGEDMVGVAQQLSLPDGTSFQVGVSSPLRPVTDSLDAIRGLFWVAVPALVLVVAAITWLAATRALAPVHAVSGRARAISAENLTERLPAPKSNDEIGELVETMNAMLTRLQRSQDRQKRLVADASHELRSPVAASRVQLEVAAASPAAADWETTAKTVLAEQERLSELIDDLLALSRLEEAGVTRPTEVDLEAVVTAEAARPRTPMPSVTCRDGLDGAIEGDGRLLTRAVGNLLDNAARHAVDRVAVQVCRTTAAVVVHVDDDGPGVPRDKRELIFERFSRLDEARDRDRGGTGLGLAIARDIARVHGGDLQCGPGPLGGARFTLTITKTDGRD